MKHIHSFHIPVMGIAFTVDTPLKVAQYGIDSVIFITDDILLEKLRKMYSDKFKLPFQEITDKVEDSRARRITSYLNLVKNLAEKKLDDLIRSSDEIAKYFNLLPEASVLKQEFKAFTDKITDTSEIKKWLKNNLSLGDINVNIMTKLDKVNYRKNEALSIEYNDAHAALRGFAKSDLNSSMVFSAGMNPRLFSYIEQFDDFFPDKDGNIKKKIVLKVSDYRSALIQGKFLAKKGIWVSEYRMESGLNCGGHAFATDGYLMGPILEEFKTNKETLISTVSEILNNALKNNNRVVPEKTLDLKITAQGGVGTAEEHLFLVDHYKIDSVGWGSPFLLVPEVTNIDKKTLEQIKSAKEDDLFLSDASPLGIPFNNIKNSSKYLEKEAALKNGRPGSPCPKKFLALTPTENGKTICTASRKYQDAKIKELNAQNKDGKLTDSECQKQLKDLTAKECLCLGLSSTVMQLNDMERKVEGDAVSICPGPNLAYYSKISSLQEMADHIYGKKSVMERTDRPNMFIKELNLYIDFLQKKLEVAKTAMDKKQERYLTKFTKNLEKGILYYNDLFGNLKDTFEETRSVVLKELEKGRNTLISIGEEIESLKNK
ncbi:FIG00651849: hypothetical protein [hydrothermal vent metagenome]|uniref:Uncharacterized protein n=1 Tax=hydrothermal vent metagenome TaxID=652676 RepID=A0A3B0U328_9ZZZZ